MTENNPIEQATQVAVAGSPSSNSEVTLNLLGSATREPLVGNMLFLTHPSGDGVELGLGMVTEVTTENQWHSNNAMLGMVKNHGGIPGMSGDAGDIRRATIKIQAAYRNSEVDGSGKWSQSGPTMRMSPPTGTAISRANDHIITDLVAGAEGIHYLGNMPNSTVKMPLNIRDFSGGRGSFHQMYVGVSGAGKTAFACYALASQFRNPDQGLIIVDPQGQFATRQKLPFDLAAFAEELGREVIVRRISEDLQLPKDAPLFGELVAKTKFTTHIMKMSGEIQELFIDELIKALKTIDDWEALPAGDVLDSLLRKLRKPNVLRLIYADNTKKIRLMVSLSELLGEDPEETIEGDYIEDISSPEYRDYRRTDDGRERRKGALSAFQPLHNLFSPTNPSGAPRHGLWGTISRVFDRDARGARPAPVLIFDMSSNGNASWINNLLGDEDQAEAAEALRILDQDPIKAAILNQIVDTLNRTAEAAFKSGETLNVQCVLDEAYRFAPPINLAGTPEVKELSQRLAQAARDMRKYGIGWTYITQTTRSVNPDIWDQITVRYVGYGLAGADIEKIAEQLDDRAHLQLYKGFSPPESTGRYPWMILGPVSPLSFSRAPILIEVYTDFQRFRDDNNHWIEPIRLSMGKNVVFGDPVRSAASSGPVLVGRRSTTRALAGPPRGAAAQQQVERIRANRDNGGVDPNAGVGLNTDPSFGSALDLIDENEPPF